MKVTAILLSVAALLSSCSSVETHRDPRVDLSHFKRFYVIHRLTDDNHIDDTIVAQLKALGREAAAGPTTMMPQNAEAVVMYRDEWAWDFKSYLIQLDIEITQAHTNRPLARGTYRQPTIVTKAPPAVVEQVLVPLFHHSS